MKKLSALFIALAACNEDPTEILSDAGEDTTTEEPYAAATGSPIVSAIGNKCLDDSASNTTNGNKIQLYTCNGTGAQNWSLTGGQLVGVGGKCVDIKSNNQVAGTLVQLYTCNGTTAQQWTIKGSTIVSTKGLCLTVAGGVNANGTAIELGTCNGSASQSWTLGSTATGTYPVGFSWDTSSFKILAKGSDLWPTTWAADDTIVAGWGDGGGFGGGDSNDRVSLGFAKISGLPPNFTTTNEWGNTTKNSTNTAPALHAATFCGKPRSMISVGGVIYAWIGSAYNDQAADNPRCPARPNPDPSVDRLAKSTDKGATWTLVGNGKIFFTEAAGNYEFAAFINFGKDNAGGPAGYVYSIGTKLAQFPNNVVDDAPGTYMVRIPTGSIESASTYEVFAGLTNGSPTWSTDWTKAKQLDGNNGIFNVFYHAATKRYISAGFDPSHGTYSMMWASQPWGTWTRFASGTNTTLFGGSSTSGALGMRFPAKWISADGRTIWAVYTWAQNGDGSPGDSFHLVKGTLVYNTD